MLERRFMRYKDVQGIKLAVLSLRLLRGYLDRGRRGRLREVEHRRLQDKINHDGYAMVPEFLNRERCSELRAKIDRALREHPEFVHKNSNSADKRIYGIEHLDAAFREYHTDPVLDVMSKHNLGIDSINALTLAGRIHASPGNLGSGDGWHRDHFANQFKALVYLNDVGPANGPFEFIRGSHRAAWKLRDSAVSRLSCSHGRIDDESIIREVLSRHPDRLISLMGRAGTLILANTSGIHRGRPLDAGVRYSLTNYYYLSKSFGPKVVEHFAPVVGYGEVLPTGGRKTGSASGRRRRPGLCGQARTDLP